MALYRSQSARGISAAATLVTAAAIGMVLGFQSIAVADSVMYRGSTALTGYFNDPITVPLALDWRYTTTYFGHNPSSPAVVGDTVYFASGSRIYAVSAISGTLKWKYPVDQPLSTTVHTSPAYADGLIYVGADDGKLYALNAGTGKDVWRFDTRSTISVSPTVEDGVVYFGSGDGRIWALDAKTGNPLSAWKNGFKVLDDISGAAAVSNGIVYAVSLDQVLHAIGAVTARERWSYRLQGSVLHMAPIVSGDFLFIANGSNVTSLYARNGLMRWQRNLGSDISCNPAVDDDSLYVADIDNNVRALDLRFGRDRWKTPAKLPFDIVAPPTVAGDVVFVATTLGGVYALDKNTGAVKWSYVVHPSTSDTAAAAEAATNPNRRGSSTNATMPMYANVAAAPVVADKALFILSDDGSLSAFRSSAVDEVGPEITPVEPDMGVVINGSPPVHFEATIEDDGSGVNPDTVKLLIDDKPVQRRPSGQENEDKPGYKYDVLTSTLTYDTEEPSSASTVRPLADGRHTVTVVAADWFGNVTRKSWTFTVDNSLAKVVKRPAGETNPRGGYPGAGGGLGGYGGGRGGGYGGGRGPRGGF
ncbi:MAG: PQQ-binding-like beta-propeller repeat protein [Chthonomonadales bacterium]